LSIPAEDTKHGTPPAAHGWSRTLKFQPAKVTKRKHQRLIKHLKKRRGGSERNDSSLKSLVTTPGHCYYC
jgi:hypothetical protein